MAAALLHFAARYSQAIPATLDIALPDKVPVTAEELRNIEATHQVHMHTQIFTQIYTAGAVGIHPPSLCVVVPFPAF